MQTQKPLSVTRNYFGPRADRLASALPISQGFGNITDLGLGMPVTHPLGGEVALDSKVRNHSGSTVDAIWLSDSEGNYIHLPKQSAPDIRRYASVIDNTTGSDILYDRGTILIRFSFNSVVTSPQPIFNFGLLVGSGNNSFLFFKTSGADALELAQSGDTGDILRLDVPWDPMTPTKIFTAIATWGEQGTHLWVDNVKATVASNSQVLGLTGDKVRIANTKQLRLGRNQSSGYSDLNLYAFCMWDFQLHEVEREELFADPYISFRPRAQDFTGSDAIELFRTDVNPMVGRATQTSATFNVVTDESISSSSDGILDIVPYFRVQYDTSPVLSNPTASSAIFATKEEQPLELVLDGLTAGTTYYWIAQYSSDGLNWYYFPGGKGRFVTQRITGDFTFAVMADDHLMAPAGGVPDDSETPYVGFGGDIFRWKDSTGSATENVFNAWRHNYDIYTRRTPDFILHCGDFIMTDTWGTLSLRKEQCQGWRNWQNLLCKSGAMYFALGNHEAEAGYFQWVEGIGIVQPSQMESTVARKLFFPNPTNTTYPEGGENEGNETSAIGNNWILPLNTSAPVGATAFTWSSFNQNYRDDNITNPTKDPLGLNKSPLQNYFAFTWSNSLFVVLDVYRYSEVGDFNNNGFLGAGDTRRKGPSWIIGDIQKSWLQTTLEHSNAKYKFIVTHNISGEEIGVNVPGTGFYYGRGSGANIKKTIGVGANPGEPGTDPWVNATIYVDGVAVTGQENPEEISLHELYKRTNITAVIKGHDHKFCHVINEEVNYISCPTGSSISQWENSLIRNSYGFSEHTDDQPQQAKDYGIQSYRNSLGYLTFDITSSSCNMSMRFTKFKTGDTREQTLTLGQQNGRWAGLTYTPDSAEQIVLSERPHDIYLMTLPEYAVFDQNGAATITTNFDGVNFYVRPSSYDPWEVFEGDAILTLDGSVLAGSNDVVIGHAPAVLYSTNILNAVRDTDTSVEVHNLRPEDVVFVYNINVSGSQEVAEYYREKRNLPSQNLIGLNMPVPSISDSCESPITFNEFMDTIYNPLLSSTPGLGGIGSAGELNAAVIILGYGTPLSYVEQDGSVVAIASRLHRLGHNFVANYPNHTYDRRGSWKFFDAEDSGQMSIVAVIDGPTQAAAVNLIDRAIDVDNQSFIPGKIYIDPFGKKITEEQLTYQSDILDFVDNEVPNLELTTVVTTDTSLINTEPTVNFFSGDSFYWGWFEPTYSKDLFLDGNERRVFLYNADNTSACQIHFLQNGSPFDSNGSDPWCNLAININPGYAATAGAAGADDEYGLNVVGEENYLRPRPFFEALHQGATMGEAFLFASPFVNGKIILIGDPLLTVKFIGTLPADQDISNTTIPNNEMIRITKEFIEEGLAYGFRQSRLLDEIINTNVSSNNFAEELTLLHELANWNNFRNDNSYIDSFARLVEAWSTYILQTSGATVQQWLFRENEKTSAFVNNILSIDNFYIRPEGFWEYRFIFEYGKLNFEPVHFQLQVATDIDFNSIVVDVNSFDDIDGWKYEQNPYIFTQIVSSGLPSNFHGRTIKYVSPSDLYLTRTNIYYVRTRTIGADGLTVITSYKAGDNALIVKY